MAGSVSQTIKVDYVASRHQRSRKRGLTWHDGYQFNHGSPRCLKYFRLRFDDAHRMKVSIDVPFQTGVPKIWTVAAVQGCLVMLEPYKVPGANRVTGGILASV